MSTVLAAIGIIDIVKLWLLQLYNAPLYAAMPQ